MTATALVAGFLVGVTDAIGSAVWCITCRGWAIMARPLTRKRTP